MRWTKRLQRETWQVWNEHKEALPHGFRIFFHPVGGRRDLAVIGFNPGASPPAVRDWEERLRPQFEDGIFSLPKEHFFVSSDPTKMAERIRWLFAGREEAFFERALYVNLICFRASRKKAWRLLGPKSRELEEYCATVLREILERVAPRAFLFVGVETPDDYNAGPWSQYGRFEVQSEMRDGRKRIMVQGRVRGLPALSVFHLTGVWAQTAPSDREKVRKRVVRFVDDHVISLAHEG